MGLSKGYASACFSDEPLYECRKIFGEIRTVELDVLEGFCLSYQDFVYQLRMQGGNTKIIRALQADSNCQNIMNCPLMETNCIDGGLNTAPNLGQRPGRV